MDAFLRKLMKRFPERELEIFRLCRNSPVFRSICEEMEMAEAAKARWKEMPERAQEYQQILDRLDEEFLGLLSNGGR